MKYRIYIDECGNSDLASSDDPNHRFLNLTGIIVNLEHVSQTIHGAMEALKFKYFGSHPDDPIILHRAELVNKKPPFEVLRDPAVQTAFDSELLALMGAWEFSVITVMIDKKKHRETYSTWRYDPYHYCLAVLLERFSFWLAGKKAMGDVMAESRGSKEDRRLKDSFAGLIEKGTEYVKPEQFHATFTSKQLKVKPKQANVSGLQLADLLSHPSRCEMLDEKGLLGRLLAPFAAKVVPILQAKYYQEKGNFYGKKWL